MKQLITRLSTLTPGTAVVMGVDGYWYAPVRAIKCGLYRPFNGTQVEPHDEMSGDTRAVFLAAHEP